jgi:hypothetical protein
MTLKISEVKLKLWSLNSGYKKFVHKWIFDKAQLLIKAIFEFVDCKEKRYKIYELRILFTVYSTEISVAQIT